MRYIGKVRGISSTVEERRRVKSQPLELNGSSYDDVPSGEVIQ